MQSMMQTATVKRLRNGCPVTLYGLLVLLCFFGSSHQTNNACSGEPLIGAGDRVALVGGTLIESLQSRGDCEAFVILRQPNWRIPFRNLGWSGDDVDGVARRVFGSQSEGYTRLMQDVAKAKPTVVVLGYGFAESSNGLSDVERFNAGLRRQIGDFSDASIRVILMLPFELPGIKANGYQEAVSRCREVVQGIASEKKIPLIDPWPAISPIGEEAFDSAGLRLSRSGQRAVGGAIAAALLGESLPVVLAESNAPNYGELSERIAEKNALFFHRYRPMNETYLFLFRKHEQGNNAVEVERFESLVEQQESMIWAQAHR